MSTLLEDLEKKTGGRNSLSLKTGKSSSLISRAKKFPDKIDGYALNLALKLKQDIRLEAIENGRTIMVEIVHKKNI